jgi:hypothetical protein
VQPHSEILVAIGESDLHRGYNWAKAWNIHESHIVKEGGGDGGFDVKTQPHLPPKNHVPK